MELSATKLNSTEQVPVVMHGASVCAAAHTPSLHSNISSEGPATAHHKNAKTACHDHRVNCCRARDSERDEKWG